MYELKRMRKWAYWKDLIKGNEGEILVDNEVLSWSYLEAGLIEAIGSLVTFFIVLDSWGIDISSAIAAQKAGGYFGKFSQPMTLNDGSVLVSFFL
jgi:sodium/potassium-transporting ATPase subunit alpha